MIHIQYLHKWYPLQGKRHYIFKDFNLIIPKKARLGVLGINGSGKSTFIRMLSKTEAPNLGFIKMQGTISWPVASGSGFQPSLSGLENTRLVCRVYGILGRRMQRVIDFIHETSGIGDFFFEPIKTYSSGMQTKFSFALSMAFEFDVYLLDEVTATGDQNFRARCQRWLQERMNHATMIYASHNLSEVQKICTSVLVLLQNAENRFFENVETGIRYYLDYTKAIEAR
jgi:capsular polysaccharide transport system ATP-binding protein